MLNGLLPSELLDSVIAAVGEIGLGFGLAELTWMSRHLLGEGGC